jgi:transcriptional regulator with XRE-family HTH domain
MLFQDLLQALRDHLRTRIRNGELTERGLARMTGISQPHLHHMLKGARLLTTEKADAIMARLRITIYDLLPPARGSALVEVAAPRKGPGRSLDSAVAQPRPAKPDRMAS